MGSSKKKTRSQQTAVTTPNAPSFYEVPVTNFYHNVGNLQQRPSSDFVTPINSIQQSAFDQADKIANQQWSNAALPDRYTPASVGQVAGPGYAQAGVAEAPRVAQAALPPGLAGAAAPMAGGGAPSEIERAQAESLLTNLRDYMNPYTERVVDTTLADLRHQQGIDQARYAAQGAKAGAFGGSRFGIGETNLLDNQSRTLASTAANLRSDAFNTGAALSNQDASRRQEANIFNAGQQNDRVNLNAQLGTQASIANAGNQNTRDIALAQLAGQLGMFNAGAQNDMGLALFNALNNASQFNAGQYNNLAGQVYGEQNANARQDANALNAALSQFYGTEADMNRFNANYDLANRQNMLAANQQLMDLGNNLWDIDRQNQLAPYTQASAMQSLLDPSLAALLTGQTINTSGTSTSKESGGLLNSLIGAGATLGSAAMMSERRVKRDILKLGEEDDGLGVFAYNYVWDAPDEPYRFGVMADEVARIRPWALGPVVDGVQTVNYGEL